VKMQHLRPFQASPLLLYGVDPLDPSVDLAFLFESQTSFRLQNSLVLEQQIDGWNLRHNETWNLEFETSLSGLIQCEPASLSTLPVSNCMDSVLLNVAS
jgi:hypothetical protein